MLDEWAQPSLIRVALSMWLSMKVFCHFTYDSSITTWVTAKRIRRRAIKTWNSYKWADTV